MVDDVLASTMSVQRRVRDLPSRVVVYLLLAGALFAGGGYRQVWARLTAGLAGVAVSQPGSSALAQAPRRVRVKPLRALFELLAGPAAGAARWRRMLVCPIDGTTLSAPDTPANLACYHRQSSNHGGSGYPLIRLLTVVACGTRTVIDAVFGPTTIGETTYAPSLFRCLRPGITRSSQLRCPNPDRADPHLRRGPADPMQGRPRAAPHRGLSRRLVSDPTRSSGAARR